MTIVTKYQVIKSDKASNKSVQAGDILWQSLGFDFGMAADDTAILGEEYISVSKITYGLAPSFTIRLADLTLLEQKDLPPPDKAYMIQHCRPGEREKTCRYLVAGDKGIECAKLTTLKYTIDQRVADNKFTARGDNCDGMGS